MKKVFYLLSILITSAIVIIIVILYLLLAPVNYSTNQEFIIKTGESVRQISQHLYDQGLLRSRFLFESYVWYEKLEKNFIAGTFLVKPGMNSLKLVRLFTSLENPNELTLQFIEGWTIKDIQNYLITNKVITSDEEFEKYNKAGLWKDRFKFLSPLADDEILEGYLFPDTYKFFPEATAEDVIYKMLENFNVKLTDEMRVVIATRGLTIDNVVKLASILEKEVKTEKDMKIVADLFNRRLAIGMLLQADSTLNYATGGKNASLTSEELALDNPYNSYKYAGLPPTPISNPGIATLRAAVYPEANEYFFFLTSSDGTAYYAKTLDEHNKNKQYLK